MSSFQSNLSMEPVGPTRPKSSLTRYVLLTTVVLSLLFSTVFGAIGILVLSKIGSQMTDLQHIAVTFHVFVQILFAIFCFLGVYACIARHASATSLFTSLVIGQILFSITCGALCLYLLFNNTSSQPWDVEKCLVVAFDNFTRQLCTKTALLKGMGIAMFVVMWLVEIVTIILGNAFLSQLREVEAHFDVLDPKYDFEGSDC